MKVKKVCPNDYEHLYWPQEKTIVGIDEAGRGPLAGPLSVAGVVFPNGYENPAIYDSKALTEKKREELYLVILEEALWAFVIEVAPEDIDRYNILEADRMAMKEIALLSNADVILTDAMKFKLENHPVIDLIKGDQKSISIAAASILAKVTRDHLMQEYDAEYPQYGFAKNKGYGTKQHLDAIEQYGITPIHRRSFRPVSFYQPKLWDK